MGFLKKVFNFVAKPIKAVVDPIIDFGTSVVKAVLSPFTGAFNLPDISINTDVASDTIKAATVVDFNGANRAIPILYGTRVETATIPIFVNTHGDDSADTSKQYLYMAAVISQGFHGASSDFGVDGGMGSLLSRLVIDGKPVHLGGISNTANDNYSQGYDGSTALSLTDSDGGIFASGKGGVQPAQHTITKGTFANRLVVQYFDGSADQPASSLLREHPDWDDDENKLSGMHYIALRFKLQAADETIGSSPYSGDGEGVFANPYTSVPSVIVTVSGRSTPNFIGGKASDPGYEERFDTLYSEKLVTRYMSYHKPLTNVNANGELVTQEKDAVHIETVPSDTTIEYRRFLNFQPAKYSNGSIQPVNIHDILKRLGWTYDYVFFVPTTLSFGLDSSSTIYDGGVDQYSYTWLKHVGGSHYQFVNKIHIDKTFTVLQGAMSFYGFNDNGNTLSRINSGYPGEDVHTDNAEYRFYAPEGITQAIENAYLDGYEMQLRIRNRANNTNDLYDIQGVDLTSGENYITLGITNLDSSKPAESFYTTVPVDSDIYVEIKNGTANKNKSPANWNLAFENGYLIDGLPYQSYICDNNPVEFILDYLLNPNYGCGISINEIDRESFIQAAIACDRIPNYYDFDNTIFYMNGGTSLDVFDRNRYMYGENATSGSSANGSRIFTANNGYDRQFIIDPAKTLLNNINLMLASIGAYMIYTNGKFKILLENAGDPEDSERIPPITAVPIAAVITDDNIIESIAISTTAMNDRFNQIKIDYTDLVDNSQPNSILTPDPILDSTDIRTNYLNEDGGKVLEGNFSFPGIFDPVTARKHGTLLLKKSRGQPQISFQCSAIGINVAPGDFIRIDSTALDIDDVYRVTDTSLNPDNTVSINCIRHVPDFYDVADTGQIFEAQRPVL